MRFRIFFPVLMFFVAALPSAPAQDQAAVDRVVAKSPLISGFQLTLSMPNQVDQGDAIMVEIRLENSGKYEGVIHYENGGGGPIKVNVEAFNEKGGPKVPYTLYGKSFYAPERKEDKAALKSGNLQGIDIAPGSKRDLSIKNLATVYDLTLPTRYVLKVSKVIAIEGSEGKTVTLDVGPVEFTVK